MAKKIIFSALGVVIVFLVASVLVWQFGQRQREQGGLPTLVFPPPLSGVEFPTGQVGYPVKWPAELTYPEPFILVEALPGTYPDGARGWIAKLRYNGDTNNAAKLLREFFVSKGWTIISRNELAAGGLLLLIEKGSEQASGTIIIESDASNPGWTKVLSEIRL